MKNVLFNQNYEIAMMRVPLSKRYKFEKPKLAISKSTFGQILRNDECPYVHSTMCKFKDCPTTQILREIKFGNS